MLPCQPHGPDAPTLTPSPTSRLTWILPSLCSATLKNGLEVCLNPEAPKIKEIIDKMLNK